MTERIARAYDDLATHLHKGRVTVLCGPRRVGKTNLVQHYLDSVPGRTLSAVGDDIVVRNLLSSQDLAAILAWAEGYSRVFIDEAQRIPDVGWALKMLIDARPNLDIIVTGSASLKLSGTLGEPLTGRQTQLTLYPVSLGELAATMNASELRRGLDDMLIYGMYPEVRTAGNARRREILRELVASYLLKDALELERVKSPRALVDLLTLVALQVGSLVSLNELAQQVGLDVKTVARYLDLLEKSFVLVNLRGFSRNLRSEVTRTSKWYFYDVGVRNGLLNNFNPLSARNDVGALWENFCVIERMKFLGYKGIGASLRFWRTWQQREIDLIEDHDGRLGAYEFKWAPGAKARAPKAFSDAYPDAGFAVVTPSNYLDFAGVTDASGLIPDAR